VRNYIKRALREYFRLHKLLFFCADINLIAKKGAEKLNVQDLRLELDAALQQITSRIKC
jgi:ribonuclease P protein component